LPTHPAPRCSRPILTSRAVCLRVAQAGSVKASSILSGMEDEDPRGHISCTHGIVRTTGILRLMPCPVFRLWGCSRLAAVAVSMYPRGSLNKVYFPSGVFGTLHSDPSLSSHSLGSNLRHVSQIGLRKSRPQGLIAGIYCICAKRGTVRDGSLLKVLP
jgi:hypothetical protein